MKDINELIRINEGKYNITELKMNNVVTKMVRSAVDENYDIMDPSKVEEAIVLENQNMMPTNRFLTKINTDFILQNASLEGSVRDHFLPRNCRMKLRLTAYKTLYVIESEPEIRTVSYEGENIKRIIAALKTSGELKEYGIEDIDPSQERFKFTLAFPYCVFIIVVKDPGVVSDFFFTFRNLPLIGPGDCLYKPPLPNMQEDQSVCLGWGNVKEGANQVLAIENSISTFWSSPYNDDYIDNLEDYEKVPFVGDFFTWQYNTQKNPMFVYDVPWIEYNTIGKMIEEIKTNELIKDRQGPYRLIRSIRDIYHLFDDAHEVERKKKNKKFFYDIASYIMLTDDLPLYIEDSFTIKDKKFFVSSYISDNDDTYEVTHMELMTEDGKTRVLKVNSKLAKTILKSIEEDRKLLEVQLDDGTVIKKDDCIKYVTPGGLVKYRKVDHFRQNFDGVIEARLGDKYFVLQNLSVAEKINMENPFLNGRNLKKGDMFLDINDSISLGGITTYAHPIRFNELTVSKFGSIVYKFDVGDTHQFKTFQYRDSQSIPNLISFNDVVPLPKSFLKGTRVYTNKYPFESTSHRDDMKIYKSDNDEIYPYTEGNILSEFLYNNGTTLLLEGLYDMCFNIGDRVIVFNWQTPEEIIKVKEIIGFKVVTEKSISAVVKSKDESLTTIELINASTNTLGRTRYMANPFAMYRTTNRYQNLSVGMKIKANQKGICNFPLKDTNIIIGFLIDTGITEPLALCSNGCTLWPSDIKEKFDIIPYGHPTWRKLPAALIDMEKIKPQVGDFRVCGDDVKDVKNTIVLASDGVTNTIKYSYLDNLSTRTGELYSFDVEDKENTTPLGVILPRHTAANIINLEKMPGYILPNGNVIPNSSVLTYHTIDYRRNVSYVQRIPE